MAERRSTRTKRRPRDEEPPEVAEDELADEPEDELDEPEDELADEPEDELDEPEDELDEPEDELADEPEDELDEPEDELADEPEDEPDGEDSGRARRNDGRGARRRSSRGQGNRLNAAKAGQAALRQILELTGKEPEGVTGVDRGEDGWVVGVEVVEDRRVPSSSDILAIFEIELDMDGELMSYRRVRRYPRGRGDDEGF
jgi:gas vesicle protein GvpO